jgi:endoglucanase
MAELFERLCSAFGPSSCEDEVRNIIIDEIKPYATSYRVDKVGNLIAFKKGKKPRDNKLLFSAHMDEVGFMVRHIDEDGFIYFGTIGGIDRRVMSGRHIVLGDNRIPAVIAGKAIHLQTEQERGIVPPVDKLFIDIGSVNREDTMKYVSAGDLGVFEPNFERFGDHKIKSKAIDDRFGCYMLCELLKEELEYDTYFAFVIQEEEGCRGAAGVAYSEKADEVVVVEGTTAGDIHGAPEGEKACILGEGAVISFMDGGTVYCPDVIKKLTGICEENKIKYQIKNLVAGGNDAQSYQRSYYPTKVAAVSAPVRYIHSACSVADERDFDEIKKLLLKITESGIA